MDWGKFGIAVVCFFLIYYIINFLLQLLGFFVLYQLLGASSDSIYSLFSIILTTIIATFIAFYLVLRLIYQTEKTVNSTFLKSYIILVVIAVLFSPIDLFYSLTFGFMINYISTDLANALQLPMLLISYAIVIAALYESLNLYGVFKSSEKVSKSQKQKSTIVLTKQEKGIFALGDLIKAIKITVFPFKTTNEQISTTDLFLFYYKLSVVILLLTLVSTIILTQIYNTSAVHACTPDTFIGQSCSPNFFTTTIIGRMDLQLFISLVFSSIMNFWIYFPIIFFVFAAGIEVLGRGLFHWFKGTTTSTLTAIIYGSLPLIVFSWIVCPYYVWGMSSSSGNNPFLVGVGVTWLTTYSSYGLLFLLLWSLYIFIVSISNQQFITKLKALILVGAVLLILIVVAIPLFSLGTV